MSQKIGFWSVFAIVTGSQIGSGIFMLPASLAPYGMYSLAGWILSSCGALTLALVFSWLCARFPQTGGPHVYVKETFGVSAAFFTGWTYWVISWVSTTAVIVACIGYLTPFIGHQSSTVYLALEIALTLAITILNLKGVKTAGHAEFFLTLLKIIPLLILPLVAIWFFDSNNFVIAENISDLETSAILGKVTLLTLWGFIGLEAATTPAGSIENPSKTIPKAIFWGTLCVAFLYIINSIAIMGLIPGDTLVHSKAPYVDATKLIFGGNWHYLISFIASFICIGTLNAWMLTSGQIALGLAQDDLMPNLFKKKNQNDAPTWGLIFSFMGIIPLLFLTSSESFVHQITAIIDYSVIAFLFVYSVCCAGFLKLLIREKNRASYYKWVIGITALLFCFWVIYETPVLTLGVSSLFILSGIPIYFFMMPKKNK